MTRRTKQRRRVGHFESRAPLAVSQVRDDPSAWETTAPMIFHSATGYTLIVEVGSRTDWASIGRLVSWLIPKMTGAAGALGHDDCWRRKVRAGELTYQQADALLEEMLAALDREATRWRDRIPAPTRWLVWTAVRWASILTRPRGSEGMWRDLPRMVAITVPGLALASPAVVLLPFAGLLLLANYLSYRLTRETT